MRIKGEHFLYLIFLFSYLFATPQVFALESTTTGFIPGQIWYSKDPLVEGDTVNVYTAIWNNNSTSLSSKVEFYDKNVLLGSREVVVPAMKLQEVSVSWKVTSGDHSISAKIISPSIVTSGKKQVITLDNNLTSASRKFVPVVLNTAEGTPASSSDVLKSQLDKATSSLDNILPPSISTPVSENINIVENFRETTLDKVTQSKLSTQKKIEALDKITENSKSTDDKKVTAKDTAEKKVNMSDATEKPISYIKIFLLSILSFILGSKFIFYSLIIVLLFFIVRGIYHKIRNR